MGARVEERGMPLRPCGWTDDDDVTPEGHFVNPRMLTRFCWMDDGGASFDGGGGVYFGGILQLQFRE